MELLLLVTPEGEADDPLFSSVVELLAALESAAGLPATLLYAWELRLLSHLGYQLRIQRCPFTGEAPDALSYQDGGAIDSNSGRPHWPVSTDTLRKLYCLQHGRYQWNEHEVSFSEFEDDQLRAAFVGLWSEITGRPLKSDQVFRKLKLPQQNVQRMLNRNPVHAEVSSAVILVMLVMISLMGGMGCQGMGEHLPSQANFDVQPTSSRTHQEGVFSSGQPLHPANAAASLPHLSNHPQDLPQDLTALTQALKSGNSSVSVALQVSAKGQLQEQRKIYCELNASTLSAEWLTALTKGPMSIQHVQPKLWIEHQVPEQLKAQFKDQATLEDYLQNVSDSSQTRSLPFRHYNPTQDQEGVWVIYFPKQGDPQSLILVKNTSWMCERAWTIATCELNDTLVELTYSPLDLKRNLISPLQLVLVSAEVHVHPVDE